MSTTRLTAYAVDEPWEASMRYSDMALLADRSGASGEARRLARLASEYSMGSQMADERAAGSTGSNRLTNLRDRASQL
jgi:hypothetical protein